MIAPRTEEGLIDSSTDKGFLNYRFNLRSHFGYAEHVEKGVIIILQPETVDSLNIFNRLSWILKAVGI
jgi:hypothetical protein